MTKQAKNADEQFGRLLERLDREVALLYGLNDAEIRELRSFLDMIVGEQEEGQPESTPRKLVIDPTHSALVV